MKRRAIFHHGVRPLHGNAPVMLDGDKDRLALNMFCYQEEDTAEVVFRPKPASHTPQATELTRGQRWRRWLSHWSPSSTATRSSEMALTTSPIVLLLSKQMPYSLPAKVSVHTIDFKLVITQRHVWSYLLSEDGVWGAFGSHPHMANEYNMDIEEDVHALDHPSVVALGDIGLDYSYK
ncbi:hypothetical protein HPB49_004696 [Dermacentor silvarum]|uniref:Uncharacterized protein n=1 Tax=Dermacentor silvarum TaxID=543639 RepID=A0ACB8DUZ3_DERSI|nr:hypothetical protein HPB49_004696 [Dermacentor silvarum]